MDWTGLAAFGSAVPGGYQRGQLTQQEILARQLQNKEAQDLRAASLASLLDNQGMDPTTSTIMALSGMGQQQPTQMQGQPPPPMAPQAAQPQMPMGGAAPSAGDMPAGPSGAPSPQMQSPPMQPGPQGGMVTPTSAPQPPMPGFGGGQMSLGQMFQRLRADPRNQGIPDTTLFGIAAKAQQSLMAPDRALLPLLLRNIPTAAERMAHEDRLAQIAATHEDRQATMALRKDMFAQGIAAKEAAKWQVAVDPSNANTPFRYNTATGEATTLDGKTPYTPGGISKLPSQTARSGPAIALQKFQQEHPNATAEEVENFMADYGTRVSAAKAFGTGKQGDQVRSINTAIQHLDVAKEVGDALGSGDSRAINAAQQAFQKQFGQAMPTNFDAVMQIVGPEIVKSIVSGGGGVTEREEAKSILSRVSSPAQLQGAIDQIKALMAGQLNSLRNQYKATTKLDDFDERYLLPETRKEMGAAGYGGAAPPSAGGGGQQQPTVSNW